MYVRNPGNGYDWRQAWRRADGNGASRKSEIDNRIRRIGIVIPIVVQGEWKSVSCLRAKTSLAGISVVDEDGEQISDRLGCDFLEMRFY
jgi:hypothetical protein